MKFLLTAFILLSLMITPTWAKQAQERDQAALNAIYQQYTQAFAALDAKLLASVYAENATYVPEQPGVAILKGQAGIVALYQKFFDRVKKRHASLEVDFRVVDRILKGNQATEICYYMVRFHPPKDTEEPVSEFAGKLVMQAEKNNQGHWQVVLDVSNRAEPALYYDATPKPNLYYGEQFAPLASPIKTTKVQD